MDLTAATMRGSCPCHGFEGAWTGPQRPDLVRPSPDVSADAGTYEHAPASSSMPGSTWPCSDPTGDVPPGQNANNSVRRKAIMAMRSSTPANQQDQPVEPRVCEPHAVCREHDAAKASRQVVAGAFVLAQRPGQTEKLRPAYPCDFFSG